MPPFTPDSLLYASTNVHSWSAFRCLATHSPPGCDVLMMTGAALQASLPFVSSASCAIEVINAIIRYARACVRVHLLSSHTHDCHYRGSEPRCKNVEGRLTRTRFRWVCLWQVVAHVDLPCCVFSASADDWTYHFVSLLNLTSYLQTFWHTVRVNNVLFQCQK